MKFRICKERGYTMARRVGKYLELLLFALLFGLCMNAMAFAGTVNETPDSSGEVSGVE